MKEQNISSEEGLLLEAQKGNRAAFDELYQKYKRPILNYIYRFIGNHSSAEELTQEVFVRAYMNIARFKPRVGAKFSSWLYRIASNLSKNFLRHAYYEKKISVISRDSDSGHEETINIIEHIEDRAKRPDESAQSKETQEIIQDAVRELPEDFREVVILCDIKGFSYEEAAGIIGCNPMTVGSRLWRAREKLAKILNYIKNGK